MTSPTVDCKTFQVSISGDTRLAFVQLLNTPDPATRQAPQIVTDGPSGKLARRMTKSVGLDPINEAAEFDVESGGPGRLNPKAATKVGQVFEIKGDVIGFIVDKVIPLKRDLKLEQKLGDLFDVLTAIAAGDEAPIAIGAPYQVDGEMERWKRIERPLASVPVAAE